MQHDGDETAASERYNRLMMNDPIAIEPIDYARRREAQERAAAKRAATLAARRVHQELAQMYAQIASEMRAAARFA